MTKFADRSTNQQRDRDPVGVLLKKFDKLEPFDLCLQLDNWFRWVHLAPSEMLEVGRSFVEHSSDEVKYAAIQCVADVLFEKGSFLDDTEKRGALGSISRLRSNLIDSGRADHQIVSLAERVLEELE